MKKKTLLILAVLITALACIFTSCSAAIDSPKAEAEEFGYVTFGNGGSRTLNTEYGIKSYNELVWFYTAEKKDGFGKTGETRDENGNLVKERINDTTGLSGEVGPLSQGAWVFTLYAYEAGENQAPTQNLVYQGASSTIVLKGGETKAVPVSVSLQGDFGTLDFSEAYFAWFKETTNQVVGNGNVYLRINISGTADKDSAPVEKTIIKGVTSPDYKISEVLTFDRSYVAGKFPAGYYTCTVQAYVAEDLNSDKTLVNEGSTYKASQAFGLRVYGNATTKIKGDLTEGLFAEVSFDVAKQDMKVFVPSSTGTTTISGINVVPDATTVTGVTKSTTVKFDAGALTAVADKTLQLDVKVTSVESANEKFNITGTDADNKSAFAGIDVTLWATDSTGSSEVNNFTDSTYATVTTYISKGLTNVAVKYNGTDKQQPIATDSTEEGIDSTVAAIITSDSSTALGYDPITGLLRFKTNHFSEYYVLADCVAVNYSRNIGYPSLLDAINDVNSGEVISLVKDVEHAPGIVIDRYVDFTVDFAGHIYTLDNPGVGSTGTETNGFQILKGAGTHTITFKNGTINISENNTSIKRIIQDYAKLNLIDMTIDGTNQYGGKRLVMSFNHGAVNILGNTNIIAGNNIEVFDVDGNWGNYQRCPVTIDTTGIITGDIKIGGGILKVINANVIGGIVPSNPTADQKSRVSITGGTFTKDPSAYLEEGYIAKEAGGKFSVEQQDMWINYADTSWYCDHTDCEHTDDEKAAPYKISTAQELAGLAKLVQISGSAQSFSGKLIQLINDIDLDGKLWTSIGQTGAGQFAGIFDGKNYEIKNLSIYNTDISGNCSSGLFGWLNNANVKNIKINTANVYGHHNVGVIAGYLETSGCTIENCSVINATVSCTSVNNDANGDKVGGIVGHAGNTGVVVKSCTVSNSTISAGRDAGQVVGAALEANVSNCSATNVTVTSNGTSTGANINNNVIGRIL